MADEISAKPKSIMQKLMVEMVFLSFAFTFAFGGWILHYSLVKPAGVSKFTAPESKQKIWLKKNEPVRFAWVGQASPDAVLEISRDPEFQNLVLQVLGPSSPYLVEKIPGEGDYFYRIVQKETDERLPLPEPVGFTIVTQDPPQLTYPFSPVEFPEEKQIRFYWKAKHGINFYRIQISFDNTFKNIISDLLVNGTQTTPQTIPVGHLFWRVRGEGDGTKTTEWSEVRLLEIKGNIKNNIANKIEPAAPVASKILVASPTPAPVVVAPAPVVQSVVEKPKASPIVAKAPKKSSRNRVPASVPKTEVKAKPRPVVKAAPKPTPPRTPQSVPVVPIEKIVNVAAPLPKLPPNGVSIVSFAGGAQEPIVFKWEVVDADNYRLEIAADDGFQKVLHSAVVSDNQLIVTKSLPKGKLFWRVRAQRGSANSDWSQVFTLEK
jgi:hypothetical protein